MKTILLHTTTPMHTFQMNKYLEDCVSQLSPSVNHLELFMLLIQTSFFLCQLLQYLVSIDWPTIWDFTDVRSD